MSYVRSQKGFTLIELLVTIAIIAVLSTVGLVLYQNAQKSARISKRIQDLQAIQKAVETFKSATGKYPIQSGSWACTSALTGANSLTPNYLPVVPNDPLDGAGATDNCYQYQSDANGYEYKIRTHNNVASSGEISSSQFLQQPTLVDPSRDSGTSACTVELSAGTISGWAIYSGTNACGYGD